MTTPMMTTQRARAPRERGDFLLAIPLALTLAIGGCDRGAPTDGAAAEHPAIVVTQWNDSTELFLEYPVPVAGEALGNWAIHLTNMKDFKPLTAGTLTLRFLQQGREVKAFPMEAPARDGIYLVDPVLDQAGSYEARLELRGPQVSSVHVLPEVRVYASADEVPAAEEEEAAGAISFLKEQQWKIDFAIEPAAEAEVARSVSAPGEIVAPDGAMAVVSAPISGIAQAASNQGAPSVGMRVSSGQVLVTLAPTAGEGGYARARGELERLTREADRAERLYAAGAIPEKRLEEARHDLDIARAEIAAMGDAGADGDFRMRVRAPLSGVVAERGFVPGGRVEAGAPLFTVVDPSRVWLRVQLPPGGAAVGSGTRAIFTLEGMSGPIETTRLVSVGSVVDPSTRTIPALFEVPNPTGALKIGQFARASVTVGGTVRGVAIPNEAILDDNGMPVAYVQVGGETFERRALVLGESDGQRTQVVEGIRPGEMVVTAGGYQVRLASLSPEGFSGGHSH